MTKKFQILSLIAIGSSMVLSTVAPSLSGAFSSIGSNFARATGVEYSVTFTRDDAYSDSGTTYVYSEQTPSGNPIYMTSTGGKSRAPVSGKGYGQKMQISLHLLYKYNNQLILS